MALAAGREDVVSTLRAHSNSASYIYPGCTCLASTIRGSRRVVYLFGQCLQNVGLRDGSDHEELAQSRKVGGLDSTFLAFNYAYVGRFRGTHHIRFTLIQVALQCRMGQFLIPPTSSTNIKVNSG